MPDLTVLLSQEQIDLIAVRVSDSLREQLPAIIRESNQPEILTVDEASRLSGFTKTHLSYLRRIAPEQLPFHRAGRKILYKRSDILAYLSRHYVKPGGL
jgi:excisionase family DNA binding protein